MASEYRDDLAAAQANAEASRGALERKQAELDVQAEVVRSLARTQPRDAHVCRGCGFVGQPRKEPLFHPAVFVGSWVIGFLGPLIREGWLILLPLVLIVLAPFRALTMPVRCPHCRRKGFALPEVIASEKAELTVCAGCQGKVDPAARFCETCGRRTGLPDQGCRTCGAPLGDWAKFCNRCGKPV